MERVEAGGQMALITTLLDDLFGGRGRLHLLDGRTRLLHPVGTDEPALSPPGPVHRALDSVGPVVEHVGASIPDDWSPIYRAWLPRGECRFVAARIEGGGEVVGVLSVVRSESSRVPVGEDRDLVAALAARFGRTAAVTLSRALADVEPGPPDGLTSAPAGKRPDETAGDSDLSGGAEIADAGESDLSGGAEIADAGESDGSADGVARAVDQPVESTDDVALDPGMAESTNAAPAFSDDVDWHGSDAAAERLAESLAMSLAVDVDRVRAASVAPGLDGDPEAEQTLTALVDALGRGVRENVPARGLLLELDRRGGRWQASLRPLALEDGWPHRPTISDDVARVASAHEATAEVIADPDLGWLVELRVRGGDPEPSRTDPDDPEAVEDTRPDGPEVDEMIDVAAASGVDLMAASLGDTTHMVMLAVASDGRVVFCNDELASRLGGSVADLLGRPLLSARGPSGAWADFEQLLGQVDADGLTQRTLAWPHAEDSDRLIRWTISRTEGAGTGPVLLCFGVDVGADSVVGD